MEKFTKYVLVVMLSLISFTAFPQDTTAIKKRPKIGLVLSGGGDLYNYNSSNWLGAGVRYSIDTKAGPLNFDISTSNISPSVNLYFSFGYYF